MAKKKPTNEASRARRRETAAQKKSPAAQGAPPNRPRAARLEEQGQGAARP